MRHLQAELETGILECCVLGDSTEYQATKLPMNVVSRVLKRYPTILAQDVTNRLLCTLLTLIRIILLLTWITIHALVHNWHTRHSQPKRLRPKEHQSSHPQSNDTL